WYVVDRPQAAVTLALPIGSYNDARQAMLRLGTPTSEHLTGELAVAYNDSSRWTTYAYLVLHLTQTTPTRASVSWPAIGWTPVDTLGRALAVSSVLFTFLVDVFIWIVVVLGPFAL